MNDAKDIDQAAPGSAAQTEPELLTKAETAHLLGVSIRTVDNMMRDNRISYVKLTGQNGAVSLVGKSSERYPRAFDDSRSHFGKGVNFYGNCL